MYKNVFFDLDGTLIDFDIPNFLKLYLKSIGEVFNKLGYDGKLMADCVMKSCFLIKDSGGKISNEEAFWQSFKRLTGLDKSKVISALNTFYDTDFILMKEATAARETMRKSVEVLVDKGIRIFVTTNPIFPKSAILKRISWGGYNAEDFEYITSYETTRFLKPDPAFFKDVIDKYNLKEEETLVVGNDVEEDCCSQKIGIDCYLISDGLLNFKNLPITSKFIGSQKDFLEFTKNL